MSRSLELIMETWFTHVVIPVLIASGIFSALAYIWWCSAVQREKDEEIKKLKEEVEELQSEIRVMHGREQ